MKLSTGLSISLAVLLTGLYTWGISTDPDGFRGLIRNSERPEAGGVPITAVNLSTEADDAMTWADVAEGVSQAVIFKAAPPQSLPNDESFNRFLANLASAVDARDVAGVLASSADNIIVSFGTRSGIEGLEALLTGADNEAVWRALAEVLTLPLGLSEDGTRCAPWFTCLAMPEEAGIIEPFETVFIMGDAVPVLTEPSAKSETLVTLSHDAVRLAGESGKAGWVKIALPADRTGYVKRDSVRMMFDYRAAFERLDSGLWAMTVFVAGD